MKLGLVFGLSLVALAFAACGDNGNGNGTITVKTPTLPAVETSTPDNQVTPPAQGNKTPSPGPTTDDATGTPAPGEEPTRTNGGNGGTAATATPANVVILPCGDILVPLDKQHRLPSDCEPPDLVALPSAYTATGGQRMRSEAADAVIRLFEAAIADGYYMYAISSYRSYEDQVFTFNYHVSNLGEEQASRVSARPGHSEHQLGTTTDVVSASSGYTLDGFVGTPEAAWIAENAWRFGFIVSYPAGMESVTGYIYEPWHIRYVGEDVAASVHNSGLTLGQYLHNR